MCKRVEISPAYVAQHIFCKWVNAATKVEFEDFINNVCSLFCKSFNDEVMQEFDKQRKKWEEGKRKEWEAEKVNV